MSLLISPPQTFAATVENAVVDAAFIATSAKAIASASQTNTAVATVATTAITTINIGPTIVDITVNFVTGSCLKAKQYIAEFIHLDFFLYSYGDDTC
jgi:hypothetical protein